MEYQINEIKFLISLAWAEGGKVGCVFPMVVVSILPHAEFGSNDYQEYVVYVGVPILKIGKCCEGVRAPPTSQKSEN